MKNTKIETIKIESNVKKIRDEISKRKSSEVKQKDQKKSDAGLGNSAVFWIKSLKSMR